MAVDQAKYVNFFNNNNNNNNQYYNNFTPQMNNNININQHESFPPLYNINDVVFNQLTTTKQLATPAVKDDSGITFNNSLQIPPQPSRKRARDPVSVPTVAPQLIHMTPVSVPCAVPTVTKRSVVVDKDNNGFAFLGQDLSLQIMQQDLELDRFISNHMERMKVEIEERKKQQLTRIIGAMGESLGRRLRDKEEQLTKLGRINYALEEKVKSLYLENQVWRDLAQTNEATANALRTNLEQLLQQMNESTGRNNEELADDAVSCCGSSGHGDEDAGETQENKRSKGGENGWIYRGKSNNNNNESNQRLCRKCGEGESSVLLLPCRHLCLCTTCGPAVNSCPICDTVKNASVHVNLS
ncbi:hypothetical protein vseg_005918 [Gypsophila vaccaria]